MDHESLGILRSPLIRSTVSICKTNNYSVCRVGVGSADVDEISDNCFCKRACASHIRASCFRETYRRSFNRGFWPSKPPRANTCKV